MIFVSYNQFRACDLSIVRSVIVTFIFQHGVSTTCFDLWRERCIGINVYYIFQSQKLGNVLRRSCCTSLARTYCAMGEENLFRTNTDTNGTQHGIIMHVWLECVLVCLLQLRCDGVTPSALITTKSGLLFSLPPTSIVTILLPMFCWILALTVQLKSFQCWIANCGKILGRW